MRPDKVAVVCFIVCVIACLLLLLLVLLGVGGHHVPACWTMKIF